MADWNGRFVRIGDPDFLCIAFYDGVNVINRIFIGIPCDKQAQRQINELLRQKRKSTLDIRWVPENNRHLTLAFLGNLPRPSVDNLLGLFDETYQLLLRGWPTTQTGFA